MTLRPETRTAARLQRIKLVLMDVDGTLVTGDQATFTRVVAQLRRLKGAGVQFSIATGRTLSGVASVVEKMEGVGAKPPPMITYNGAVVSLQEKPLVLKIKTIEQGSFRELVRVCRTSGVSPLAYACTTTPFGLLQETTFTEAADGPTTEFNGSAIRRVSDLLQLDDDVVAVLIKKPPGAEGETFIADLAARFAGDLRVTTSGGPYVEVCHPEGTKRHAMIELVHMLGLEAADVMAIGDNFNDLEMIESAGVGVAVFNAPPLVKAAATLVCSRSGAQGVVEVLRVLSRVIRTEKALAGVMAQAG